jgi:radical SAM superfamily enzyme YgiQ (UPF0313 family)
MKKILFIHTPKFNDFFDEAGDMMFINIIPNGVFSMASHLSNCGYDVRVLHLGIEWIKKGGFDPCEYIDGFKPDLIAMPLHWHHQSYDVIETARRVGERFPEIPIVLGGLTAGYFAGEILEKFIFVDFIISGDGEVPLEKLAEALTGDFLPDFSNIPNLFYRDVDGVVRSKPEYSLSQELFDSIDYCRFDLLEDFEFYRDEMGIPAIWLKNYDINFNRTRIERMKKLFFPVVGKGCSHNCSWCGRERRKSSIFRTPESVVGSIRKSLELGFEYLYFTFDPNSHTDKYYIRLFELIKQAGIDTMVYFESWSLPSQELLKAFKEAFSDGVMGISPETASEKNRKFNNRPFFTNDKLFETLKTLDELNIETDLFFCAGMPGEDENIFLETQNMIKYIRDTFKCVSMVSAFGLFLEPASPWYENPEKFGILPSVKCFMDYYMLHAPGNRGSYKALGYYVPGYFADSSKVGDTESFEDEINMIVTGGKNPLGFCMVKDNETT